MKTEPVLVLQIMGQTALVLRATPSCQFEVVKVGPNFSSVAHEKDLVTLIEMNLPTTKGKK